MKEKNRVEDIFKKYMKGKSLVDPSARIFNVYNLERKDFIENENAAEEMLDLISILSNHNISICIAGQCGSGRTTLLNTILNEMKNKKIFTIEECTREFNLSKCREKNTVIPSTRNYKEEIEIEDLLAVAIRVESDVICLGEIRDKGAFSAQEVARTGHTVITTVHSDDCYSTYERLVYLCKKETDIDGNILMKFITEAFPIVVYIKQLADNSRKITEIMECIVDKKGNISYNTLFRYKVTENRREQDKIIINGYFEKVNNISDNMKQKLIKNCIPYSELQKIIK